MQLLCGGSECADVSCDQMCLGADTVDGNATGLEPVDESDERGKLRPGVV